MKFPHCIQLDAMDCGPTCLRMIAKFYGKNYSLRSLRTKCHIILGQVFRCWVSVRTAILFLTIPGTCKLSARLSSRLSGDR